MCIRDSLAVVGFIDTMMVSVLGDYAIAAVGLTTQPKMLALAVFMAMAPAVSALVARRKGEDNRESAVQMCIRDSTYGDLLFGVN